jgi:hypothetical protein
MLAVAVHRKRPGKAARRGVLPACAQGGSFAFRPVVPQNVRTRFRRFSGGCIARSIIHDDDARQVNARLADDAAYGFRLVAARNDNCALPGPIHAPR